MKSISGKELARTVERHGWQLLRIHGSHHVYGKSGSTVRLSIPIHANRPLKLGLLKHLLKQAGLDLDAVDG
ncbi:MAG TPA: type II toxin-antitoxin system HicA family toxin [Terriglobia bacterium]|nr:type II toxin-antitoxin system HicA family toxin [Terriglobia bacterium]